MIELIHFVLAILASPFKSKLRLEAENAMLRGVGCVAASGSQTMIAGSILQVLTIIRPETLVRWHRAGFRCYWRWKSRPLGGRPQIETGLRVLIRRMSVALGRATYPRRIAQARV
jgi:hypothetical protein